jgi:inositol-phosphate transport system permease protein
VALVEERTNAGAVASRPAVAAPPWWSRYGTAAFFMGPALLMVAAFFVAPVIITLGMSLTDMATTTGLSNWQWTGLDNYERMARGSFTLLILGNTIFYVVVTLTINVLAGLGIALLSTNVEPHVGGVFRALWLLPRISPSVVYALMWTWAAAAPPYGVINQLVEPFGIEGRYWINSDPWLIVFLINGFVGASFGMLIFTSAIKSIPEELFRAARVDGANAWQIARRITLPLLRWPILFVLTYQTMSLFASYEYILLTTNGGPGLYATEVWSLWAFHTALSSYFGNLEFGYGSALAAVLVVMGLLVSFVLLRIFRFNDLVADPRIEIT